MLQIIKKIAVAKLYLEKFDGKRVTAQSIEVEKLFSYQVTIANSYKPQNFIPPVVLKYTIYDSYV